MCVLVPKCGAKGLHPDALSCARTGPVREHHARSAVHGRAPQGNLSINVSELNGRGGRWAIAGNAPGILSSLRLPTRLKLGVVALMLDKTIHRIAFSTMFSARSGRR
jgi:hypothetical protein